MSRTNDPAETQEENTGLSRRQLLAGGAGVASLLAAGALVSRPDVAEAASAQPSVSTVSGQPPHAVSIFLKLTTKDGTVIQGESNDPQHLNEIEISSWSWGASNPQTGGAAGGSGFSNGKITVQKSFDRASPLLIDACDRGTSLSGQLTIRKAGGKQLEYLTIQLQSVFVTDVSFAESTSDARPAEEVSFIWIKMHLTYDYVDSSGKVTPYTVDIPPVTP